MSFIPLRRRIEYARGYIELGLTNEAVEELEAIEGDARMSIEVRRVYVDLYMATKEWGLVVAVAKPICEATPKDEGAWIAWAFALRELQQVKKARDVLLKAEPLHGRKSGVLHYNLACYASLLCDRKEAKRRLSKACRINKQWRVEALDDPDLKEMWDEIAAM